MRGIPPGGRVHVPLTASSRLRQRPSRPAVAVAANRAWGASPPNQSATGAQRSRGRPRLGRPLPWRGPRRRRVRSPARSRPRPSTATCPPARRPRPKPSLSYRTFPVDDERRLEVHVPPDEVAVGIPEQLDRVRVALPHETKHVRPVPDVVESRSVRHPVVEVALACDPLHELATTARLAVDPETITPLADDTVRPAPPHGSSVDASEKDGFTRLH